MTCLSSPWPVRPRQAFVHARERLPRSRALLVAAYCSVALTSWGCGGAIKQAAQEATPAAVEEAADEAQDPETRNNIAQLMADPQIRDATAGLSEAVVGGALVGLSDAERAAQLQRVTDAFVATVGAAVARSLRNDVGPQLSATFSEAVDRSLARALDAETEARVSAMALAVTRGAMQGFGELVVDPTTGRASPFLSHMMGQFAREMARQGAFGFDEAVREAERGHADADGRLDGGVLAAAGRMSDWAIALPPLLIGALAFLALGGAVLLGLALWRLQHHRRMSRAHEEAALALARAIKATESAAWSDELRSHIARATRDDAGGAELRQLLRDHAELRLRPRDAPAGSERAPYMG